MGSILSVLLFVALFYLMMRFGCGRHIHGGGCCGDASHDDRKRTSEGPRKAA